MIIRLVFFSTKKKSLSIPKYLVDSCSSAKRAANAIPFIFFDENPLEIFHVPRFLNNCYLFLVL